MTWTTLNPMEMNLFIALICSMFLAAFAFAFWINYELAIRCWFLNLAWALRLRLERLQLWFVYRLPRWVIRWAVVRATLHATSGKWSNEVVSSVTATTVMDRWEERS